EGNADGGIHLPGEDIHAPGLETHLALGDETPRPSHHSRTIVSNATPGQRTEKADHVVLRAVTLPVVRHHRLAPAPLACALRLSMSDRLDLGRQSLAVLPADRLLK